MLAPFSSQAATPMETVTESRTSPGGDVEVHLIRLQISSARPLACTSEHSGKTMANSSPVATGNVVGANAVEQGVSQSAEDVVAGRMAKTVVESLEVVEVEHKDGKGATLVLGAQDRWWSRKRIHRDLGNLNGRLPRCWCVRSNLESRRGTLSLTAHAGKPQSR